MPQASGLPRLGAVEAGPRLHCCSPALEAHGRCHNSQTKRKANRDGKEGESRCRVAARNTTEETHRALRRLLLPPALPCALSLD